MTVIAQHRHLLTAEDLYKPGMPEKFVELIEGEIIAMTPAGWRHGEIGYNILKVFEEYCRSHPSLHFAGENSGFRLRRGPDTILCPDASLFRWRPRGDEPWMEFAPEIAVEVLSPGNSAAEIAYKRRSYFDAGSEQVWVLTPSKRSMEIYFPDRRLIIFQGEETAVGEGLAEGMQINLSQVFAVRE